MTNWFRGFVARSIHLTRAKLFYYLLFATSYKSAVRNATLVLVNSLWTLAHRIWRMPCRTLVLFPPCDLSLKQDDDKATTDISVDTNSTNSLQSSTKGSSADLAAEKPKPNEFGILSIAQFRGPRRTTSCSWRASKCSSNSRRSSARSPFYSPLCTSWAAVGTQKIACGSSSCESRQSSSATSRAFSLFSTPRTTSSSALCGAA